MNLKGILLIGLLGFSSVSMAVNINTASAEQISSALSGIGPAKAQAIVEHCQKNGCNKLEDLLAVKGIGSKTLEKIADQVKFHDKES